MMPSQFQMYSIEATTVLKPTTQEPSPSQAKANVKGAILLFHI